MKLALIVGHVMSCKMIKSICIVRLSALGDVIMALPMLRTLQRDYPEAEITWVISRPAYDLVEGIPGVHFVVIDKPRSLADYWRLRQQFKNKRFDLLLATQASLRANLIYPLIKARFKLGYDKRRAKDMQRLFVKTAIEAGEDHTLEALGKFATHLSQKPLLLRFDLPISDIERQWVARILPAGTGPILVINPAASKAERCWLPERYREVILYAQARWQARVILVGGPGSQDKILAEQISEGLNLLNLVGQTKPKQLAALIEAADLVLCPDTGPSHMASAVATPVVALHAVTNPAISGPYTFQHLAVNCYPQAMAMVYPNSTSPRPFGTQVHDDKVMSLISVEAVIEQMSRVLEKT